VFVRVAGLVAAGGDGVGGVGAGFEAGDLDGGLEAFGGEGAAVEEEAVVLFVDLGGAQEAFGGGDADGAAAVALADGAEFGGGFDFAFGEERVSGGEGEAVGAEAVAEAGGEVVGD